MADPSKTEKATPRRRQDYRKKGSVAKSAEVNTAVTLIVAYLMFRFMGTFIFKNLRYNVSHYLSNLHAISLEPADVGDLFLNFFFKILLLALPFMAVFFIAAIVANLAQVGFLLTAEPLKPTFSKLNPISGAKNLFSMKSIENLIKSLIKVTVIGYYAFTTIKKNIPVLFGIYHLPIEAGFFIIVKIASEVLLRIIMAFIVIAIIDYIYQRYTLEKKMRMSKQEIKEEHKRTEGDPQIKGAIRRKQMEMARRRMMAEVPKADVVVTNPIHVAVAIQYDAATMPAPKIVAKGMSLIAERIKAIADEHDIPIIENPPLARALYKSGQVEKDIPYELYSAVAEVLTYVYKLSGKRFGL